MKKYVHIVSMTVEAGVPVAKSVATVVFEGGTVHIEGDSQVADQLRSQPIITAGSRAVLPAEGLAYLQALSMRYRSAALVATGVLEGEQVEPYKQPSLQKAA